MKIDKNNDKLFHTLYEQLLLFYKNEENIRSYERERDEKENTIKVQEERT